MNVGKPIASIIIISPGFICYRITKVKMTDNEIVPISRKGKAMPVATLVLLLLYIFLAGTTFFILINT